MSVIETEIKKMRIEFKRDIMELRKMIATRLVADKWVSQSMACALLNVNARQLRNIRVHLKDNKPVGSIGWKKGRGKSCLYYMPDIEKYRGAIEIRN